MSSQDAAISIALRFVDQARAPYNQAMDNMVSTAVKAAAAVGLSFGAVDVFKVGFDSVERFKLSVAEATAFITTFSEKSASGDLAGGFKDANDYAMRLIPALEAIDAKTIASGKDLTAMSNTLMQNGVLLDIDNQKQVQGFINIANALSLVTVGQNKDVQIRQEINALMQGQIRATDRLPKLLAAIDPKLQEHLKLWKEQGTTVENVGEMLKGFGSSADLIEETWAAVGSSLETVRDKVLRDGFAPIYKDILGIATEIRTSLIDSEGQLTPLAKSLQNDMREAYEWTKKAVDVAGHFAPPIVAVVTALGAAKVAQIAFNVVARQNPYILAGTAIYAAGSWLVDYTASIRAATAETEKFHAAAGWKDGPANKTATAHGGTPRASLGSNDAFQRALALEQSGLNKLESSHNKLAEARDAATAPALKITEVVDENAIKKAEQLAEQWTSTKRNLEQEINLSGLNGLDKKLQEITDKATEYHIQFDKAGGKASIDAWEASQMAVARQADEMEKVTKGIEYKVQANEDLLSLEKELELAGMSKDQREIQGIKDTYDLLLEKSHLLTLMGRQTEEAEAVFARAVGVNMQKDLADLKNKTDAMSQFQIQAFRNMQDAGVDFFESLRTGSDDWLDNFTEMTLKMVDQWAAAQMMMAMVGEDFGKGGALGGLLGTAATAVVGMFGGDAGITSAAAPGTSYTQSYDSMVGTSGDFDFSSLFGGGRAGGGPVSAGKIYEVNEQNIPELLNTGGRQYLMMGSQGGLVTPVRAAGAQTSSSAPASGSAPINITIIAADAQSITEMMRRNPQAVLGPLREALQRGDRGLRSDLQRVM